jgi:hypothetical protein
MALNAQHFTIIDLPQPSRAMLDEFETLPLDPYCGGKFRYRRFSQYRMHYNGRGWEVSLLPHRPFIQSKEYNPLVGGVRRHLEPLRFDPSEQLDAGADAVPLDRAQVYQLNVHQVRVVTNRQIKGVAVPEGPHRDGHEIGMIAVFRRRNIRGGITQLMPSGGGAPFFETTLKENQAVVYRDDKMFHHATDIEPLDDDGGLRDIWIVAMNAWENRRYGDEFERRATQPALAATA